MGLGDSKLEYKKGLEDLAHRTVPPTDVDFWKRFWMLPSSSEDIFAMLKPDDIRKLKKEAPHNFATLLFKVLECQQAPFIDHTCRL
jgi:hypothetical protein